MKVVLIFLSISKKWTWSICICVFCILTSKLLEGVISSFKMECKIHNNSNRETVPLVFQRQLWFQAGAKVKERTRVKEQIMLLCPLKLWASFSLSACLSLFFFPRHGAHPTQPQSCVPMGISPKFSLFLNPGISVLTQEATPRTLCTKIKMWPICLFSQPSKPETKFN